MKRRYAVVWVKQTLFGKMVDIAKYTADSSTEAENIGILKAKNDKFGKCIEIVTIDYEKEARKAFDAKQMQMFIETWGNCDWFNNEKN